MKNKHISDDLLAMAARLHYLDGVAQQQAAKMLNMSQAKVSRLLALARERGIVQISVKEYAPRNNFLENCLRTEYKFREAIVIKTGQVARIDNARQMLGYFGSEVLSEHLRPDLSIGLAGGRAIMGIIDGLLKTGKTTRLTVVQLMGNVESRSVPTDASELGRKLAADNGNFFALNTPVFLPSSELRNSLLALDQIHTVFTAFKSLNLALVGLGIPENSIFTSQNVIDPKAAQELRGKGVVGEICGRFFDANGNECKTRYRDRVISIEFPELRRIRLVFGVVCGADRSAAIKAAARGGLINALLIDEKGAKALLQDKPK